MKDRTKICPICGATHNKRRAKCCCIEHSKELSKRNCIRKPVIEKTCPKCGKLHTKSGKFCSRHCANSHIVSKELRKQISESVKRYNKSIDPSYIPRDERPQVCQHCGKEFHAKQSRKFCSKECYDEATYAGRVEKLKKGMEVLRAKGNLGGYREGSGRAKHGYYKGVYCGSTYELVWLIYQLDHGNPVERFQGELEWNGVKYIPDFLQDGKIVELKGYEAQESVDKKTAVANHFGYEVSVLKKEDLKREFDWVKEHYTYKNLQELYDDYKPAFTYTCDYCGKEFSREREIKSKHRFCSRSCAGNFRNNAGLNKHWWKDPNDKTKTLAIKDGDPIPEGWVRGKWQKWSPNTAAAAKKRLTGTVFMFNPATQQCQRVFPQQVADLEQAGWRRGRK